MKVPLEILAIAEKLRENKFEAYLVGGCVRDLLLERKPKDWDFATNALPEQIVAVFNKSFYENEYGTVGVVNEGVDDPALKVVEITPYREESTYSDYRRPDKVSFGTTLENDLARRDFTINAIALDPLFPNKESANYKEHIKDISKGQIIDPYKGQKDIKDKIIRAVGIPEDRFREDGLRMLRAVRISAELCFTINIDSEKAIKSNAELLKNISKERIRDEFCRILESPNPLKGLNLCLKLGILKYILPELEKTVGVKQNKAHSFDVWLHLLKSVQHAADKEMSFHVKLSALFHDIAKPATKSWSKEKNDWTFYGHDVIGAKMTEKILKDLRFPAETIEKVVKLVRWHMFFSDTEKITLSAVRRLVSRVGKEDIWHLMNLRACDRIGTGRPKESPYRLRKYHSMIEEVMRDPISVSMLNIKGDKVMKVANLESGPKIGHILHILLEEVLEDPGLNTAVYLEKRAKELAKLSDSELKELGNKGRIKKIEEEEKKVGAIRSRHWVK